MTAWPNRDGPEGLRAAMRATAGMVPGAVLPVGAGASVDGAGGGPLGLADDGVRPSGGPGAAIDQVLADHGRRLDALESGEVGEVA